MSMRLQSFRVTTFRSVNDSGTIETDDVTALVGVNESGKSNLLLPLWKLKPAKDGEIKDTADFPRKQYVDIRNLEDKPFFIDCIFVPDQNVKAELARLTNSDPSSFDTIRVRRKYDKMYYISFPQAQQRRLTSRTELHDLLNSAANEIHAMTPLKVESDYAAAVKSNIANAIAALPEGDQLESDHVESVLQSLEEKTGSAKSAIAPRYMQLRDAVAAILENLQRPLPEDIKEARQYALKQVPPFVYYTSYGNLDSEIYLPHVIENMERSDLGAREEAKVRTLKVLFEFVGLQPQEILELGRDFKSTPARTPTAEEIEAIAEKKKKRSILLQSASAKLTHKFREWWKQGEYRFNFEADGDHFRIWVSDDKRPEAIELEGRSTGLQWFLSFYLVFLVESQDEHAGAILLLDEPGMSLHPLAQKDLSAFFDGLAKDNQLIYTTHSPFLIDPDRLDRARKVYVAADGTTKATPDLRSTDGDKAQNASGYAVHAALGLTVAESLLLGCTTVVVEGLSDQIYLSMIKTLLIGAGRLKPHREIVFPPAGGAKGVKVVASILTGRNESLPMVLFDNDKAGDSIAQQLRRDLYVDSQDRVLQVGQFISGVEEAEIEDLIPPSVIHDVLYRWQRSAETIFQDAHDAAKPVVPQIEHWARSNNIELATPAWKVEFAKRVKQRMIDAGPTKIAEEILDAWTKLFEKFVGSDHTTTK